MIDGSERNKRIKSGTMWFGDVQKIVQRIEYGELAGKWLCIFVSNRRIVSF